MNLLNGELESAADAAMGEAQGCSGSSSSARWPTRSGRPWQDDLVADTIALGINAIVFTRNVVRFTTALVYDVAAELRGGMLR